jgi:sacsin
VSPTLEFVITSDDITGTGAPATLLIFNNEKGFSPKNIESICSVGRSTKKGNRSSGYIGEKGTSHSHIYMFLKLVCSFDLRRNCAVMVIYLGQILVIHGM